MRGKLFRCRVSESKRLAERGPRREVMPVWALKDPSEVWSCQHASGKSWLLRQPQAPGERLAFRAAPGGHF